MNREKVIKHFEHLLNAAKGNYQDFVDLTVDAGEDILTLLKEQEAVVRCKDCKHYRINTVYPGTNMIMKYCAKTGIAESNPDWFCADGEVREC